jgi:SOS-response transcriptional repressor LexA
MPITPAEIQPAFLNLRHVTAGQGAVWSFVWNYAHEHGYAPTFREVAKGVGVSLATARQRIRALERIGTLEHTEGVCRSLRTKERTCEKANPV